jgi:hypothetical protein
MHVYIVLHVYIVWILFQLFKLWKVKQNVLGFTVTLNGGNLRLFTAYHLHLKTVSYLLFSSLKHVMRTQLKTCSRDTLFRMHNLNFHVNYDEETFSGTLGLGSTIINIIIVASYQVSLSCQIIKCSTFILNLICFIIILPSSVWWKMLVGTVFIHIIRNFFFRCLSYCPLANDKRACFNQIDN